MDNIVLFIWIPPMQYSNSSISAINNRYKNIKAQEESTVHLIGQDDSA